MTRRWGADAARRGDAWWRGLTDAERAAFQQEHRDIAADYGRVAAAGHAPDSAEADAVVRRHVAWLARTPAPPVTREYVIGLGEMYVADPRFAANYPGYVEFVRDAMRAHAEAHL